MHLYQLIFPTFSPLFVVQQAIFDEEFLGGRGLQGSCSQFRGRLCAWSALLRVSQAPPIPTSASGNSPQQSHQHTQQQHTQQQQQQSQPQQYQGKHTQNDIPQGTNAPRKHEPNAPISAQASLTAAMMTAATTNSSATPAEQQAAARQILLNVLGNKKGSAAASSSKDVQHNTAAQIGQKVAPPVSDIPQPITRGTEQLPSTSAPAGNSVSDERVGSSYNRTPLPSGTSSLFPEPIKRVNTAMIYKIRREDALRAQLEEMENSDKELKGAVPEVIINVNAKSNGSGRAALMLAAGIQPPPPLAGSMSAIKAPSQPTDKIVADSSEKPSISAMLSKAVAVNKNEEKNHKKTEAQRSDVAGSPAAQTNVSKTAMLMSMLSVSSTTAPVPVLSPAPPPVVAVDASKALLSLLSINPKKSIPPIVVPSAISESPAVEPETVTVVPNALKSEQTPNVIVQIKSESVAAVNAHPEKRSDLVTDAKIEDTSEKDEVITSTRPSLVPSHILLKRK